MQAPDSETLGGDYRRVDCGEYRIVYDIDRLSGTVNIILIGERNDGEVYQKLARKA